MKNRKKSTGSMVVGVIIGLVVGIVIALGASKLWMSHGASAIGVASSEGMSGMEAEKAEKKPLYWVAPMDANYRRDKPGQSPMGMDLIPFYPNAGDEDEGPGTIRVSPDVINNLGVRTAIVKRLPMHSEIKTVGYVKYDEDQLFHIHPRVEGWIETLYVKAAGDPVKKGQPLYDIYSPALVNAQEEFVLALSRKNQRLIKAAEYRLSALQLPENAIRTLKKTRKVKQTITVVAPESGVVDNLNIREGVFVKPGTTVMSIGSLEQVWVEAEVFERQVFQVSAGLPVTMTLDFLPGKSWLGKVDYVYPTLNAKTRTVKLRLRFDNKSKELKPNMFAEVVIHTKSDGDALLVPKEAIIRTGSVDRVVLALGEGRFKSIDVNLGRFDEQFAEIAYGLKEGERVVTSAQFLLDSESSKTSDFKRMNHDEMPVVSKRVWVEATVNSLMPDHRMVNVDHKAIDEWGWADMTMDFTVVESVDFSMLKVGMPLQIEIEKAEDFQYLITDVRMSHNQTNGQKTGQGE